MAKKTAAQVGAEIREEVTNKIISTLEYFRDHGFTTWKSGLKYKIDPRPCNAEDNRRYRGVNIFICLMEMMMKGYTANRWLTYNQAKKLGGVPNRDLKGESIRLTYSIPRFMRMDTEEIIKGSDKSRLEGMGIDVRLAFMAGPYTTRPLFNVDCFDGLPDVVRLGKSIRGVVLEESFDNYEQQFMVDRMVERLGVPVKHVQSTPCYRPLADEINIPEIKMFETRGQYLSTLTHECVHATGHDSRLARGMFGKPFGSPEYAKEELVAEMGNAFICSAFGIEGNLQHPEYIHSWLKALDGDTKAVFWAAARAEKAMDFLIGDQLDDMAECFEEEVAAA